MRFAATLPVLAMHSRGRRYTGLASLGLATVLLTLPANVAVAKEAVPVGQETAGSKFNPNPTYPVYPDPDVVQGLRLCVAIKRDDAEAVLRLLDAVDVDDIECAPVLNEAARFDSWQVAEVLLEAGFDANLGVDKRSTRTTGWRPLNTAAEYESPRVAEVLIEHGADVSTTDEVGWTPLHYALTSGVDRPAFQTANLLLEHGADVNAATAAVGWTPLHLAAHLSGAVVSPNSDEPSGWNVYEFGHGPDVLQIVQRLIERGADVGARTRVGAWSPARVVKASDEHRRYGLEAGASSQAVLAAIQAAGGKEEGCNETLLLPAYEGGRPSHYRQRRDAAVAPGCEYNLPFAVPSAIGVGGYRVAGSFTAPGADEALLFVSYGIVDGGRYLILMSLQDQQGAVHPIMASDYFMDYEGLCLDSETNTHAAVFGRSFDGKCCGGNETAYYHYAADAGNLVEVFAGSTAQPTGKSAACRWREEAAERDESRRDSERTSLDPSL